MLTDCCPHVCCVGLRNSDRVQEASCELQDRPVGSSSACRTVVMVSALAEKTEMWMVCLRLEG